MSSSVASDRVRLGIAGVGSMGQVHARQVLDGKVPRCELTALCDTKREALAGFDGVPFFGSPNEMLRSGKVDAVLIATPHYDHTTVGIAGLEAGLHVLVEKPISVHKADCLRLISAHKKPKQVFAAMFNQRTDPFYQKIRELVQSGELGKIQRVNWIVTNWFRSEAYYSSGGWRATWAGEGGGVLLNQCPHNLDLFQWMFGMPKRVRAWCSIGKYHNIEVEDDVNAFMEFADGGTAVFITSTGEAPGTNRLEIAGDRGRLVYENDVLKFVRNETPTHEYSRTTTKRFEPPAVWNIEIPISGHGGQHNEIIRNFVDAILDGTPLIARAEEGIHSVELANAMLLSSFEDQPVDLPIDPSAYEAILKKKISESKYVKKVADVKTADDFASSFR
jgi:predicted dehydrogenase